MKVVLDSGPVGLVTNPNISAQATACNLWLDSLVANSHELFLPEIIDYEIRRELIRAKKWSGLQRLDALKDTVIYLPLDTVSMLKAAEFWAEVRQRGRPTAGNAALDIDVILAAQAWCVQNDGDLVVATVNKKHLSEFVPAEHWKDIEPIQP